MTVVLTLLRTEFRSRWRAWLAVALLVGVAGGVVLATATGARRTDTAYARFLRSSKAADVVLSPTQTGLPGYYAAVARLPGAQLVAPIIGLSALDPEHGNAPYLLDASLDGRMTRDIERPKLTQGRMPDPARPDEAMVDRFLAAKRHLHVGSVLHLLIGNGTPTGFDFAHATPVTIHVVGLGVTRDDVVQVNALAGEGSMWVTPPLLQKFSPDIYAFDGAFIRLSRGTSVAAFGPRAEALVSQYPETGATPYVALADEHQQAAKVKNSIHPQAVALVLFALLAGLIALLIIGQVIARQVFVASADHPTLRALGMGRGQLLTAGLAEVGVTMVIGAALAVAVAGSLSPLTPIGPARVAEPHPGVAFNWAMLGIGASAIMVLFVLRVAPLLWRTASGPAGSGRSVGAGGAEQPSRLLELLTRVGAPVSAAIGGRLALERGRGRTAVPVRSAIAGTALAVAAVAAAFTFGSNLVRLVTTPRLYGQAWQVSVDAQFGQIGQPQVETLLHQQPGVSGWTLGNHGEATIGGHQVPTVSMTGASGPPMFPTLLEGRAPRSPDEIVLGAKSLAAAHRRVGQTVMVSLNGAPTPQPMRVVGRAVFPFFGFGSFTPTGLGDGAATLAPAPSQYGYNFVLIGLARGPNAKAEGARLANRLDATGACPQDQFCSAVVTQRPVDVNNYDRIKATPLALAGVLAVLAVATVAQFLVMSSRRRRRDFAVLKTLGFVRRQVSAAVAWQASILVGLALLVGLPIGVAAGRWTWQVFATRLGVAADPQLPLVTVLVSIPVALAIANAVAFAPGWLAGRQRPAPVLRAE